MCAPCSQAAEGEASARAPMNVQVLVEVIELSAAQYSGLTFGDAALLSDDALRAKLVQSISDQQATVIEVSLLSSRENQSARVVSATERIYPTEYEAPLIIPTQVNGSGTKTLDKAAGYSATAFEQRPVGTFLDIRPQVDTKGRAVVEFHWRKSGFKYFKSWASWKDEYGESDAVMPIFSMFSAKQSVTLENLKYHHLATITPMKNEKERDLSKRQMIFVRSKLTP